MVLARSVRVTAYAELHALSNFSFLRGASAPGELVATAAELGYRAIAITDECSVAGVVRAHEEATKRDIKLIIGSELRCDDGLTVVALAQSRRGYGALCQVITRARRAADKGTYSIKRSDLCDTLPECLILWIPHAQGDEDGHWLRQHFDGRLWVAIELHSLADDQLQCHSELARARRLGLPAVASTGALMHHADRQPLMDVLTAIRLVKPVSECGYALEANAERVLKPMPRLLRLYGEDLLKESVTIADRCTFSLSELRYEYPREIVPDGETAESWLRHLTYDGARSRWPDGIPAPMKDLLEHELALIRELHYEPYFLTVQDLVREARARGILCQGRGSAANSAVCFALGVTAVDPARQEVLFERFISKERAEPPDIDIDFEHERREEIIQYIYEKYGRHRAGLAATVITYRRRSALRDVGKALGFDELQIERLIFALTRRQGEDGAHVSQWIAEAGFDSNSPMITLLLTRVNEILQFPRHLSQHVGGFVIAADLLETLVPIENASMEGRTVIQWDKDDLESLGLLKVDVLALGILTAIRKALDLHNAFHGTSLTFSTLPAEDPATYEMICAADTVGVFQIESRAQMSMLPRLRPCRFYDLVIEVAIVRPGPIQGDMVHPYLRRRSGREPIDYPSTAVRGVLERTLGVPIFQEQVMRIAVVAAGFTGGEADQLRRAMAAWRKAGDLAPFREKLFRGLIARGYQEEFADRLFRQIQGFGEYGFPESHAASFALLAYASAWLKCHCPAAFTAALINSQPMGFYPPAQLVRDARRHGVPVLPIDVCVSDVDCTLERAAPGSPGVRLGLCLVRGLSTEGAARLVAARGRDAFASVQDLARRSALNAADLEALAAADAFASLAGNRHHAAWVLAGIEPPVPLLAAPAREATPMLRIPTEGQNIAADYRNVGLTLRRHPLALLRDRFLRRRVSSATELKGAPSGHRVTTAGLVLLRQSPGTANNTTFMTLEDESGEVNVIVWQSVAAKYRVPFLQSQLLEVTGTVQHESGVTHLIAESMRDRSTWLGLLHVSARNFH
jgi:error-prone DNA polymerase